MITGDGRLYDVALALTKGVRAELVWRLNECGISTEEFFLRPAEELIRLLQMREKSVPKAVDRQLALEHARHELKFVNRAGIRVLMLGTEDYPQKLASCVDAPVALFMLGDADVNAERMVSVVGTRRCTSVGVGFVENFCEDISAVKPKPTIVSGLAYGIDTVAHENALRNDLPTIGVLAHGLDTIYPSANRTLARDIVKNHGALITEYPSATRPYRGHFLERNRIVAGISDFTLVVESEVKGGAMSTARLASEYNRQVGAVPGRWSDEISSGCNHLISMGRSMLVASARDVLSAMGWQAADSESPITESLFGVMEGDRKYVFTLLTKSAEPLTLTSIRQHLGLNMGELLSLLGEMEFDGLVRKLPGNRFVASYKDNI